MNDRISTLEEDMAKVKTDLAVVRSNYATKEDLFAMKLESNEQFGKVKEQIALMSAQFERSINKQTWRIITWVSGMAVAMMTGFYFIALNLR